MYYRPPSKVIWWYFFAKWSKFLRYIITKVHSPSFKALENPWTATFKRYFLVTFAKYLVIFVTLLIVYSCFIFLVTQRNGAEPCSVRNPAGLPSSRYNIMTTSQLGGVFYWHDDGGRHKLRSRRSNWWEKRAKLSSPVLYNQIMINSCL